VTRSLRQLAVVTTAATSVVLAAAGYAQAAELITKQSCRDDGGTYAVKNGYRTCTVVTVYDESLGLDWAYGPYETDGQERTVRYVGETEPFITIRYTQVFRQRGNETPAMTGGDEILNSWTEERCYAEYEDGRVLVDNSECESRGLL
jgi:hypothetical protein